MPEVETSGPYFLQNTEELETPEESSVIGEIPSWLKGNLYAVAPALWDLPEGSFLDWLDGQVIFTKFQIQPKAIKYSKKFIHSSSYKKAIQGGKPASIEFGTNPFANKGMLSKLKPFTPYDVTDNCLGNIVSFGNDSSSKPELTVISEGAVYFKINPMTLETTSKLSVTKSFNMSTVCPHPFIDPATGDTYSVGSSLANTGLIKYHILKMPKGHSKFETLCTLKSRWYSCISFQRCFAITQNYVVFVEQPAVMNALKMAGTNLKGYCVRDWMEWKGSHEPNKFYVIDKVTGKVVMGQKFEVKSDLPFHSIIVINAYEDGSTIKFDIVTSDDTEFLYVSEMTNLRKMQGAKSISPTKVHRFVIPLVKNLQEMTENKEILKPDPNPSKDNSPSAYRSGDALILKPKLPLGSKNGLDFGHINELYVGKKHSYFYATACTFSMNTSKYFGKLVKANLDTGEVITWEPERKSEEEGANNLKYIVTNPAIIPRESCSNSDGVSRLDVLNGSTGSEEDDGVVISACISVDKKDKNFVGILDAKTFKELARVYFDSKIPMWCNPVFIHEK